MPSIKSLLPTTNPYSNPLHPLSPAPIPQKEKWLGVDTVRVVHDSRSSGSNHHHQHYNSDAALAEARRVAGRDPDTGVHLRGLELLAEARRAAGRDEVSGKKIEKKEGEEERRKERTGMRGLWRRRDKASGKGKEMGKRETAKTGGQREREDGEQAGSETANPFRDPSPRPPPLQEQSTVLPKDKGKQKATASTPQQPTTGYDFVVQKMQEREMLQNAWEEPAGGFYAPRAQGPPLWRVQPKPEKSRDGLRGLWGSGGRKRLA